MIAVELERTDGKHWHIQIGVVEKWVAGIVAGGFIGGLVWFASNVLDRLDKQAEAAIAASDRMGKMELNQAVQSGQLLTLSTQLSDVPALRTGQAELKVRVDALEEGQRELRHMRGLR